MKHWTTITRDDGDYFIDCSCGWSGYDTDWDGAVEQARQHKNMEEI